MTIQASYYHPDIRKHFANIHFNHCQCLKISCTELGLLPEYNLTNTPWYKVTVDLIELLSAKTEDFNGEFYAVTFINTTTNLVILVCIDTKSSNAIARKFVNIWLTQYPRLVQVVHDNGGEFTRYAFAHLLFGLGIKDVPTTNKNPHSNATYKHMHQTMVTVLKISFLSQPPLTPKDVLYFGDDGLSTKMNAMRSTITMT